MKIFPILASLAATTLLAFSSPATADSASFDEAMKPILKKYLVIQEALASDKTHGVAAAAKAITKASKKLDAKSVTGEHKDHFAKLPEKIQTSAKELSATKDLESAREAFKKLSRPIAMWAQMTEPEGVSVVFCSMAKGSWVQSGDAIRNPFYGSASKMGACGEVIAGASLEGKSHEEMGHGKAGSGKAGHEDHSGMGH